MHPAYNPEMALHTTHRTKPAPASSLPTRRRASHVSKFCCTPCCATLRSGRRHSYTKACCTRQLPAARVPGTLVATLTIKAQAETPTVPRGYPPQSQGRLSQQRASGPTRITSASTGAARDTSRCRRGAATPSSMHNCKCTHASPGHLKQRVR